LSRHKPQEIKDTSNLPKSIGKLQKTLSIMRIVYMINKLYLCCKPYYIQHRSNFLSDFFSRAHYMRNIEIQLYLDPLQSTLFIFCVLFEVTF